MRFRTFQNSTEANWPSGFWIRFPPHSYEDASAEGIEEAVRRRNDLDSGKVRPLSSDEFWASIERLRATWK